MFRNVLGVILLTVAFTSIVAADPVLSDVENHNTSGYPVGRPYITIDRHGHEIHHDGHGRTSVVTRPAISHLPELMRRPAWSRMVAPPRGPGVIQHQRVAAEYTRSRKRPFILGAFVVLSLFVGLTIYLFLNRKSLR